MPIYINHFLICRSNEKSGEIAIRLKLSEYKLNENYALVLNILLVTDPQIQFLPTTMRQFCEQKNALLLGCFLKLNFRNYRNGIKSINVGVKGLL